MEHQFDSLAKAVSGAPSRREALRRLGGGLAAGVLALFGLGTASQHQPCQQICAFHCINNHAHPDERDRGACIRTCIATCHEG